IPVALDRQDIQKRDFPIARRGYDPDTVDAHLRAVADDLDELQRQRPSAASLATAASEQVRSIVEAAETTAADIRRQAEDEAALDEEAAAAAAQESVPPPTAPAAQVPAGEAPAAAEPEEGKAPTVEPPAEEAATPPDDSEGARLIALNMALNGTPREETDRY